MNDGAFSSADLRIPHLDAATNRAAVKYRRSEQLGRILWGVGSFAFRLSLRPMFGWRRVLLRLFGAKIGKQAHIYASAKIYMPWNLEVGDWAAIGEHAYIYNLGAVRIGASATVSYRAHICAGSHDFEDPSHPLLKLPVTIEAGAWIGTDAFIGPNTVIGANAIVGARAVVTKSVAAKHVVAGNPARTIRIRS